MNKEIPLFRVSMNPDININDVLTSGYITQGNKVEEYEAKLKEYFNYPFIISVNSATSGLTLAVRLLNLPPQSEILCTPLTCLATNFPVLANGHVIKWVDVDEDTLNIDLSDLENKITENTRAILFVHWGGYPVDLDRLQQIISFAHIKYGHKISVIEDCAHAFGSIYKQKWLGTQGGTKAVYSTQAIKHLTTGDGGFMLLPDEETYRRAKLLRWFGIDREKRSGGGDFRLESDVQEWGYKFHMNDINASIGISNLPFINENIRKIRENVEFYKRELSKVSGVQLLKEEPHSVSSYWLFTIKIVNKSEFIPYMKEMGVVVSQVHNRNDIHSCMSPFKTSLPTLDKVEKEIVCIPCGWWVSCFDREYIVNLIKKWCVTQDVYIDVLREEEYKEYVVLLKQMNNFSREISRQEFSKKLQEMTNQGATIIVLKRGKEIVATGKIFIEKKVYDSQGHIEDIVVDAHHRGKGYSKKVLNKLIEIANENQCYKISVCAVNELERVYHSVGFKTSGSHFVIYNNSPSNPLSGRSFSSL